MGKYYGSLVLICVALLFIGLGGYDLHRSTEPRVAGIAAEMLTTGDIITPSLNGQPFLEKPPLYFWIDAASQRLFGRTPLAARLPSALAGVTTALLLLWGLARLGQPPRTAWLAAVLLATMMEFWSNARQVELDMLLTLGVTAALLGFAIATGTPGRRGGWLLYGVGIAVAVMTKGLAGLAVPGAVIGALLVAELVARRSVLATVGTLAAVTAAALLPLAAWLALLYRHSGGDAVTEVVWANSIGRFVGDFHGDAHVGPFYYYLAKLGEIFQPWTLLVYISLWEVLRNRGRNRLELLAACWLVAPFVLLSLAAGKRPVYLLPLYPAAAVLAAGYCARLLDGRDRSHRATVAPLYAIGMSLLAGAVVIGVARATVSATTVMLVAVAMGAVVVALGYTLLRRYYNGVGMACLAVMLIGYPVYATRILPQKIERQSWRPLMDSAQVLRGGGYGLALYQPDERLAGAWVFYLGGGAPSLWTDAERKAFLARPGPRAVLTRDCYEAGSGRSTRVISRFAAGGDVLCFVTGR